MGHLVHCRGLYGVWSQSTTDPGSRPQVFLIIYNFYRELKREKIWNRLHLVPLLQAEADRDLVRRYESLKQKEAEIMKNVPGWVPLDLHAPVPGLGKFGVLDPSANEPVYHNKQFNVEPNVILDLQDNSIIPAQSWRGQKVIFKNPSYHERSS